MREAGRRARSIGSLEPAAYTASLSATPLPSVLARVKSARGCWSRLCIPRIKHARQSTDPCSRWCAGSLQGEPNHCMVSDGGSRQSRTASRSRNSPTSVAKAGLAAFSAPNCNSAAVITDTQSRAACFRKMLEERFEAFLDDTAGNVRVQHQQAHSGSRDCGGESLRLICPITEYRRAPGHQCGQRLGRCPGCCFLRLWGASLAHPDESFGSWQSLAYARRQDASHRRSLTNRPSSGYCRVPEDSASNAWSNVRICVVKSIRQSLPFTTWDDSDFQSTPHSLSSKRSNVSNA